MDRPYLFRLELIDRSGWDQAFDEAGKGILSEKQKTVRPPNSGNPKERTCLE